MTTVFKNIKIETVVTRDSESMQFYVCIFKKYTHTQANTNTIHDTHSNTHHVCATFIFEGFLKVLPAGACRLWSLSYGRPSSSCAQCPFLPSAPASVYRHVSSSITLSLPTSSPAQFNLSKKRIWAAVPKLAAWPAFPGRPASSPEKMYVTQENTKMKIAFSRCATPSSIFALALTPKF